MASSVRVISDVPTVAEAGDLIYAQSKYVAYMLMDDNEFLDDCRVVFVDEAQDGSIHTEMILLSIRNTLEAREKLKAPIHFVIMGAPSAIDFLIEFFEDTDVVKYTAAIPDESRIPHSGIEHCFVDESINMSERNYEEETALKIADIIKERQSYGSVPSIVVFAHDHDTITTLMEVAKQQHPDLEYYTLFDSSMVWPSVVDVFRDAVPTRPQLLLAIPQSVVGLSLNGMTDAIIIGYKEDMTFVPKLGQDVKTELICSQPNVQYLAHRVGRTIKAKCHYMFRESAYKRGMRETQYPQMVSQENLEYIADLFWRFCGLHITEEANPLIRLNPQPAHFHLAKRKLKSYNMIECIGAGTWSITSAGRFWLGYLDLSFMGRVLLHRTLHRYPLKPQKLGNSFSSKIAVCIIKLACLGQIRRDWDGRIHRKLQCTL